MGVSAVLFGACKAWKGRGLQKEDGPAGVGVSRDEGRRWLSWASVDGREQLGASRARHRTIWLTEETGESGGHVAWGKVVENPSWLLESGTGLDLLAVFVEHIQELGIGFCQWAGTGRRSRKCPGAQVWQTRYGEDVCAEELLSLPSSHSERVRVHLLRLPACILAGHE